MSRAIAGLIAGMALGFAGFFGGFGAFLLVAALGVVGLMVGQLMDGDLGPGSLFRPRDDQQRIREGRRRSREQWLR
ncbi:hypothetical protein ACFTZI_21685 [Streptomyces decoyicus]|uniref:hypothetical protein n=1 Tax=Streptomyces decoyicus TaxID=249567 RepID=UPI003644424B